MVGREKVIGRPGSPQVHRPRLRPSFVAFLLSGHFMLSSSAYSTRSCMPLLCSFFFVCTGTSIHSSFSGHPSCIPPARTLHALLLSLILASTLCSVLLASPVQLLFGIIFTRSLILLSLRFMLLSSWMISIRIAVGFFLRYFGVFLRR